MDREIELKGIFHLLATGGRTLPMYKGYMGVCNIKGTSNRQDSFAIHLPQDKLELGESCPASISFLFSYHTQFGLKFKESDVLEMHEGNRKIGQFYISEIVSEKLRR